jgi:hypothetical protein
MAEEALLLFEAGASTTVRRWTRFTDSAVNSSVPTQTRNGRLVKVHPVDLGGDELRPEPGGLLTHPAHQLRTHHTFGETGKVLHVRGQHELATGLVTGRRRFALEDEGSRLARAA